MNTFLRYPSNTWPQTLLIYYPHEVVTLFFAAQVEEVMRSCGGAVQVTFCVCTLGFSVRVLRRVRRSGSGSEREKHRE